MVLNICGCVSTYRGDDVLVKYGLYCFSKLEYIWGIKGSVFGVNGGEEWQPHYRRARARAWVGRRIVIKAWHQVWSIDERHWRTAILCVGLRAEILHQRQLENCDEASMRLTREEIDQMDL